MRQDNQKETFNRFIQTITNELSDKAPRNTGALSNSFTGELEASQNGFEVSIKGLAYASFLDQGVNGTEINYGSPYSFTSYPNIGALSSYANAIGINPYALATSLYRKGIRPRGFITNNIDNQANDLGDDIINALWDDYYEDNKTKDN